MGQVFVNIRLKRFVLNKYLVAYETAAETIPQIYEVIYRGKLLIEILQ